MIPIKRILILEQRIERTSSVTRDQKPLPMYRLWLESRRTNLPNWFCTLSEYVTDVLVALLEELPGD